LTAVVHTAAVLSDDLIDHLTGDGLQTVLRAKATTAWHLHELVADDVVTVYYSSATGLLGGTGTASYAAANAVLDALAEQRNRAGRPTHCLAWGMWGDVKGGFTAAHDEHDPGRAAFRHLGLRPMSTDQGLDLFDRAIASPYAWLLATPVNLRGLRASGLAGFMPLWQRLVPAESIKPTLTVTQLLALAPDQRRPAVLRTVMENVAAAIPGGQPDPDATFKDLGLTSLGAVELRNRLNLITGLKLPATLVFDQPTPAAVADHILATLLPEPDQASAPAPDLPALAGARSLLHDPRLSDTDKVIFQEALDELCSSFLDDLAHHGAV
jgi:acyl carrier protein